MPFAAAAGACVWGPKCQVPRTHGHLCKTCKLPAHTACTFENVMAFATSHRGTGADGERAYVRAVETADTDVCPVCHDLPGVAPSVQAQGGLQAVVARIANATGDVAASVESEAATSSRRMRSKPRAGTSGSASKSTRGKGKKVVECKELQGKLEKHRCKPKSTETIP